MKETKFMNSKQKKSTLILLFAILINTNPNTLPMKKLLSKCKTAISKKTGKYRLYSACKKGNLKTVKYLIKELKINPEIKNSKGDTPLDLACLAGHLEIVTYIMKKCSRMKKCKRQYPDSNSFFCACSGGHLKIVKYFIETYNIDPRSKVFDKRSALDLAIINNKKNIVKYLFEKIKFPLHQACKRRKLKNVKYLIEELAYDPLEKHTQTGESILDIACKKGYTEIIEYLIKNPRVSSIIKNNKGKTILDIAYDKRWPYFTVKYLLEKMKDYGIFPLHLACSEGDLKRVKRLIRKSKIYPGIIDSRGATPLDLACSGGHLKIVKYLIEEYNTNYTYLSSMRPLELACLGGHLKIVKYLIEEGNTNHTYNLTSLAGLGTMRPMDIACLAGHLEIVTYLITKCGHIKKDKRHFPDSNSFFYACSGGHLKIVKYLIETYNIDPRSKVYGKRYYGKRSALDSAFGTKQKDIIKYLYTKIKFPLHQACERRELKSVKYLMEELAYDPLEKHTQTGESVLDIACKKGYTEIIEYLIKIPRIYSIIKNNNGKTILYRAKDKKWPSDTVKYILKKLKDYSIFPLYFACGDLEIIKYLTEELNIDPSKNNYFSNSLLGIACLGGHLETVKYLMEERNIDPNKNNYPGTGPLELACLVGHLEVVKYLIEEHNIDPNKNNYSTTTNSPLYLACGKGDLEIVKYLIEKHNVDPKRNSIGSTPLHIACSGGHVEIVKYLIEKHNLDLNKINDYKHSPLDSTCSQGNLEMVKYLIEEHNLDPNKNNNSPLLIACSKGELQIVKYLVEEHNIDLNYSGALNIACRVKCKYLVKYICEKTRFPLHQACEHQTCKWKVPESLKYLCKHQTCKWKVPESLKYLIEEFGYNSFEKHNMTGDSVLDIICKKSKSCSWSRNSHAKIIRHLTEQIPYCLHDACQRGKINTVKHLMRYLKFSGKENNLNGENPFHIACKEGHLGIAKYLIEEHNLDPKTKNSKGDSPLHLACSGGHLEIVKYLIEKHSAKPFIDNRNQEIPLQKACLNGHLEIVKYLMEKRPGHQHYDGSSLYSACSGGHLKIVKYLIEKYNIDPSSKVFDKRSALDLAISSNKKNIVRYLFEKTKFPLHQACEKRELKNVKYLIEELAYDPFEKHTKTGESILDIACKKGYTEIIEYLIKNPCASSIIKNNNGKTILDTANDKKWPSDTVKYILEKLKDYSIFPLYLACSEGDLEIIKYLIKEHNIDPKTKNSKGETPLYLACLEKHIETAIYLIEKIHNTPIKALKNHEDYGFLNSCKILYLQYPENEIVLFDTKTGEKISEIKTQSKEKISEKNILLNKILYIQYSNNKIDLFDISSGEKINESTIHAQTDNLITEQNLTYHNHKILYIIYQDKKIDLFDTKNGNKLNSKPIQARKKHIECISTNDAETLYVLYSDNQVDLFDIKYGDQINKKPIWAKTKPFFFYLFLNKKILCLKNNDSRLDLFCVNDSYRNNCYRLNQKSIQLDKNKDKHCSDFLRCLAFIQDVILCVRYEDGTPDLFHIPSGKKADPEGKNVKYFRIEDKQFLHIVYEDNSLDLFNIYSFEKLNKKPIETTKQILDKIETYKKYPEEIPFDIEKNLTTHEKTKLLIAISRLVKKSNNIIMTLTSIPAQLVPKEKETLGNTKKNEVYQELFPLLKHNQNNSKKDILVMFHSSNKALYEKSFGALFDIKSGELKNIVIPPLNNNKSIPRETKMEQK